MGMKFTNQASATIGTGINNSVTSLVLSAGLGALFPALGTGDYFYVVLSGAAGFEIVKVTARATDTLTIVRAQDNTTAKAFSAGELCELRPVAASLQLFANNVAGPAFCAYRNGAQSITSGGAYQKVSLNAELFDTDSAFDEVTNFRFQPLVAGYYQFNGQVSFQSTGAAAGAGAAALYKNGAICKYGTPNQFTVADGSSPQVSGLIFLNGSTDYVELMCFQSSGGAVGLTTGAANGSLNRLEGVFVRA